MEVPTLIRYLKLITGDYPQVPRRREVGLLDEGEGSLAHVWVITSR